MIYNKQILTGLEHDQYEHSFDREALRRLEKIPFLTTACEWVTSNFIERIYNVQYTGSNLKVTKENYPKIYQYLENACRILDIKKIPELYITWEYEINACTIGAEHPIIIINSGLIDLCDDDEISFRSFAIAPLEPGEHRLTDVDTTVVHDVCLDHLVAVGLHNLSQ